jgi:hypothetical protein
MESAMSIKTKIERDAEEEAKNEERGLATTAQPTPPAEPQEPEPTVEPQEPTQTAEPPEAANVDPVDPDPETQDVSVLKAELAELRGQLAKATQVAETRKGMLTAQAREFAAKQDALKAEIDAIKQQLTKPTVAPELENLTDEERSVFKDGQLPPEVRMAKGYADKLVKELEGRMKAELEERTTPLKERHLQLEAERARTAEERRLNVFFDALEKQVAGARVINEQDPNWFSFLDTVDPDSIDGETYRETAQSAIQRGDVAAVAARMLKYQRLNPAGKWKTLLASMARPETRKVSGPVVKQQQPNVWKRSEVEAWHDSRTRGDNGVNPRTGKRLTAAESKAFDEEIEKAAQEGRIVPG